MKEIYNITKNGLKVQNKCSKNYWIQLTNPSEEEVNELAKNYQLDILDIKKALDKSELPHIETNDSYVFYILPFSFVTENNLKKYRSHPFGIFFLKEGIITISLEKNFLQDEIKNYFEKEKTRTKEKQFLIYLISKSIEHFLKNLNEIQEEILKKEKNLRYATNKDLESMLHLQKSLLYFTTAIQGNKMLLEKIENMGNLSNSEIDLLHDVQIETKQALEMTKTYQEILETTMNTYGTIISNNLNDRMKFLTSITLVISIPTMISSFLGMNVFLGEFGKNPFSFLLIVLVSSLITLLLILVLHKKNLL